MKVKIKVSNSKLKSLSSPPYKRLVPSVARRSRGSRNNSGVMIIPETNVPMEQIREGMHEFIRNYNQKLNTKIKY